MTLRKRLALALGLGLFAATYWLRYTLAGYLPASGLDFGMTRNDVRKVLRDEARATGFDPDWFDAIARVESLWRLDATNLTGSDGALGGSYGPMQMTRQTATRLGFNAPDFLTDARLAAQAAAKYLDGITSFADAVAYWNGGVRNFDALGPGHRTRLDYWPKAQAALAWVAANPPS